MGRYCHMYNMPPWILLAKKNSTPKIWQYLSMHSKDYLTPLEPNSGGKPWWLPLKVINPKLITIVCPNLSCNLSLAILPFYYPFYSFEQIWPIDFIRIFYNIHQKPWKICTSEQTRFFSFLQNQFLFIFQQFVEN